MSNSRYKISTVPGPADYDVLMNPGYSATTDPINGTVGAGPDSGVPKLPVLFWLIGIVAVAVLLHLIHREEKSGADPNFLGISAWNFLSIGVLSSLFILTVKIGANKWAAGTSFASVVTAI